MTRVTVDSVWIFHGARARFSGGVFTERATAELWILAHRLTGILTRYPVDVGVYDWAVKNEYFLPEKPEHQTSSFVGGFTSARMEHIHFADGIAHDSPPGRPAE